MLILYAGLKYDYGDPSRGYSFEHYNFYDSLVRMGHDVLYFDIGSQIAEKGRTAANRLLLDVVRTQRADALFSVMFREELDKRVVREISEDTDTTTIAWFSDDHWRFDTYSRLWAPHFNWCITTSAGALDKYRALGYRNIVKSQWACNTSMYRPLDVAQRLPVSFVGLPHGNRRFVVQRLVDAGIEVHTFGLGWENGRVTQEDMVRIFNESCINLNLSNASVNRTRAGRTLALALRALPALTLSSRWRASVVRALDALEQRLQGPTPYAFPEQIKGRNFEVPGCGGFLLTAGADNLEDYYNPGEEVALYRGQDDLLTQVRVFLEDSDRRAQIARAGYQRTRREHTWAHRFSAIFTRIGLPAPSPGAVLSGNVSAGQTEEIR